MRNTKALIADAFAQLLEEKPYRRITVREGDLRRLDPEFLIK